MRMRYINEIMFLILNHTKSTLATQFEVYCQDSKAQESRSANRQK